MPWRMTLTLIFIAVIVFFAAFNINNATDISFGFYTFKQVPIFVSLFIAFLCGAVFVLPVCIRRKKTPRDVATRKGKNEKKDKSENEIL